MQEFFTVVPGMVSVDILVSVQKCRWGVLVSASMGMQHGRGENCLQQACCMVEGNLYGRKTLVWKPF
jgi:hypothetical protein